MTQHEKSQVDRFATDWLAQEGYAPAAFQKAIALQRFRRGETTEQIIAALVSPRVA